MARLREATMADMDVLVRHRRKMFEEISDATAAELDAVDRAYRRWARGRMKSGTYVAFVVELADGRIPASGALWLMPLPPRPWTRGDRAPYLMSMYTEREDRGKGYATRVVDAAIRWAKLHGHKVVILHASDEAKGIYAQAGFRQTSEMRLRLDRRSRTATQIGAPRRDAAHGKRAESRRRR